jgi:hypothetical protein
MLIKFLLAVAAFTCVNRMHAQESTKHVHRFAFVFSHTHFDGLENKTEQKKMVIAASIGLNYEWSFAPRWAVGIHNDLSMLAFKQRDESGAVLHRKNPWLVSLVGVYKASAKWSFFAGPGREFEQARNFTVIKSGFEFGLPLWKSFEVGFGGDYDIKINGADSWLLGFNISFNR